MHRLELDEMPEWTALFDPKRFQDAHQQPQLKDWKLDQADLLDLAKEVVEIRARINSEASRHADVDGPLGQIVEVNQQENPRNETQASLAIADQRHRVAL